MWGKPFQKGNIPWNKGKKGIMSTPWNKGLTKKTDERVRKYGEKGSKSKKGQPSPKKGIKLPKEQCKKMSESSYWRGKFGKESAHWKGNNCKKKQERNDPLYANWVKKIKRRDNNTCRFKGQNCSGYNIVHHILPWRDYPELRYEVNNGITLCQFHHPRKRVEEQRLIPFFQEMVGLKELI